MKTPARLLPLTLCAAALACAHASAQTGGAAPRPPQSPNGEPAAVSADPVANEIGLLRRSLQTLNTRLREISEKLLAPDAAKPGEQGNAKQHPLAIQLDLLARTEQRAEGMRKQLIELTEKEIAFKTRVMQLDEEMRPDAIDRALSGIGTTRTPDLREYRRRVLDNERRGVEYLLGQTTQSRARLEEDVRQADALVQRLRMKLYPLIEKEIDKIGPE